MSHYYIIITEKKAPVYLYPNPHFTFHPLVNNVLQMTFLSQGKLTQKQTHNSEFRFILIDQESKPHLQTLVFTWTRNMKNILYFII